LPYNSNWCKSLASLVHLQGSKETEITGHKIATDMESGWQLPSCSATTSEKASLQSWVT